MNVVTTGTLVGYEGVSGQKLFTHMNRPIRLADGASSLPLARDIFIAGEKQYRVIGVRRTSTEILYEIDVREEPAKV